MKKGPFRIAEEFYREIMPRLSVSDGYRKGFWHGICMMRELLGMKSEEDIDEYVYFLRTVAGTLAEKNIMVEGVLLYDFQTKTIMEKEGRYVTLGYSNLMKLSDYCYCYNFMGGQIFPGSGFSGPIFIRIEKDIFLQFFASFDEEQWNAFRKAMK